MLNSVPTLLETMKIESIKMGARGVTVQGTVESIGEKRLVNLKTGGTNNVADAVISDDTGSIKLTLWGSDCDKFRPGDKVLLENGYVSTFKGENSLQVGKFGKLKRV